MDAFSNLQLLQKSQIGAVSETWGAPVVVVLKQFLLCTIRNLSFFHRTTLFFRRCEQKSQKYFRYKLLLNCLLAYRYHITIYFSVDFLFVNSETG